MSRFVFERLISHGYFPPELPPGFTSSSFATFVAPGTGAILSSLPQQIQGGLQGEILPHFCTRHGNMRRLFGIVHPISYAELAWQLSDSYQDVSNYLKSANVSLSKPLYTTRTNRAFTFKTDFGSFPIVRAFRRTSRRFIARTDVTKFFQSIYTHSIPWALHTKAVAKARLNDHTLLGNRLDKAARNCNSKQTVGLPIGPDTSYLLSEILLTAVDARLSAEFPDVFRFGDDYEFPAQSYDQAEDFLGKLQLILQEYCLNLNESKTRISRLPEFLDHKWITRFRGIKFEGNRVHQRKAIFEFFEMALDTYMGENEGSVMLYATQSVSKLDPDDVNLPLLQALLLQAAMADTRCLRSVVCTLARHKEDGKTIIVNKATETFNILLLRSLNLQFTNDAAWTIWAFIVLGLQIDAECQALLLKSEDPVLILLAIHAIRVGSMSNVAWPVAWGSMCQVSELDSQNWLVAYEVDNQHLNGALATGYVAGHAGMNALKAAGVKFYEFGAGLPETRTWASEQAKRRYSPFTASPVI